MKRRTPQSRTAFLAPIAGRPDGNAAGPLLGPIENDEVYALIVRQLEIAAILSDFV